MNWPEVVLVEGGRMPERKTPGAAGWDCYSRGRHRVLPYDTVKIPLGFRIAIPPGHFGHLVLRSSIALGGKLVAPAAGCVDADYRGEVQLIVAARGEEVHIGDAERVVQLIIQPVPQMTLVQVQELGETERGECGFGSTGVR